MTSDTHNHHLRRGSNNRERRTISIGAIHTHSRRRSHARRSHCMVHSHVAVVGTWHRWLENLFWRGCSNLSLERSLRLFFNRNIGCSSCTHCRFGFSRLLPSAGLASAGFWPRSFFFPSRQRLKNFAASHSSTQMASSKARVSKSRGCIMVMMFNGIYEALHPKEKERTFYELKGLI